MPMALADWRPSSWLPLESWGRVLIDLMVTAWVFPVVILAWLGITIFAQSVVDRWHWYGGWPWRTPEWRRPDEKHPRNLDPAPESDDEPPPWIGSPM